MHIANRLLWILGFVALLGSAHGNVDVSLKLGVVLPGWDGVQRAMLEQSAADRAQRHARRLGHVCALPEVFVNTNARTLRDAHLSYKTWLPSGSREEVFLDDFDQRVSLISRPNAYVPVLSVLALTDVGVLLILC